MAYDLHYFNSTTTGASNYYVLLFQQGSIANGGGLTDINFPANWTNTVVRDHAIQLVDTGHAGIYFADFLEGVPAGRYQPVVYQASGDPTTTATTTDTLVEVQHPLDWTGTAVAGIYDAYSFISDVKKIIQAQD